MWIEGCTNYTYVESLNKFQLLYHEFLIHSSTFVRSVVMTVHSFDLHLYSFHMQYTIDEIYQTISYILLNNLKCHSITALEIYQECVKI